MGIDSYNILLLGIWGFFLEGLEGLFGFLKFLSQLRILWLQVAGSFIIIQSMRESLQIERSKRTAHIRTNVGWVKASCNIAIINRLQILLIDLC